MRDYTATSFSYFALIGSGRIATKINNLFPVMFDFTNSIMQDRFEIYV